MRADPAAPVPARSSPARSSTSRASSPPVALAIALVLSSLIGLLALALPAGAVVLPRARCAAGDHGISRGLCVGDGHGRTFWLGTFRGYDGIEMYCLDYAFATRWDVGHRARPTGSGLITSLGGRVGPATTAALGYLVWRHPARSADDTTAAAIALIIREVMGDVRGPSGQLIPGGLTVASSPAPVSFIGDQVLRRAVTLWQQATGHRGPWSLGLTLDRGSDGVVTPGERLTLAVRARNGAGRGEPMTVLLAYRGLSGPARVSLGRDGSARVSLTAPLRIGEVRVSARSWAPSSRPVVLVPAGWTPQPHLVPGSSTSQRGLVAGQQSVAATAAAGVVVVRSTPTLHTQVSAQRVAPGRWIHDLVTVSGAPNLGTLGWSLLGPVPPRDGVCPADPKAWLGARVLAGGRLPVHGDGDYPTPGYRVAPTDVGCLTYTEDLAETATTTAILSPPGLAAETVLVVPPPARPCLATTASRRRGEVGGRLFDRVRIGCIGTQDRLLVRWTAYGPLAPRRGVAGKAGCDRIPAARWSSGPVAARGSFAATGPGTRETRSFVVRRPGCYTFGESIAATGTTEAAASPPGLVAETSLITRPPLVSVPSVPTGPYRVGWARVAPSAGRLRIPSVRLSAPVSPVGVVGSAMQVPPAIGVLGWLAASARPEDVVGSSVIAGHVGDRSGRPGAFGRLGRVRPGARILWTDDQHRTHRFVVVTIRRYPRANGLPAAIFGTDGPHLLRLLTCARRIRLPGGGFHYADNLVVTARAVG